MKDIKGYEGHYAITEDGQVWSYKSSQFLTPLIDKDGYYKVSLSLDGIQKQFFIHRLVAQTYLPNLDNKPTVDHLNGIITDNHINNLQWATYSEQNLNQHWQKKRRKPVLCKETDIQYNGITEVNKVLGLNMGHLSECLHGKRNTCGGYHWVYVSDETKLRGDKGGNSET